jgi:hypothetical protein
VLSQLGRAGCHSLQPLTIAADQGPIGNLRFWRAQRGAQPAEPGANQTFGLERSIERCYPE